MQGTQPARGSRNRDVVAVQRLRGWPTSVTHAAWWQRSGGSTLPPHLAAKVGAGSHTSMKSAMIALQGGSGNGRARLVGTFTGACVHSQKVPAAARRLATSAAAGRSSSGVHAPAHMTRFANTKSSSLLKSSPRLVYSAVVLVTTPMPTSMATYSMHAAQQSCLGIKACWQAGPRSKQGGPPAWHRPITRCSQAECRRSPIVHRLPWRAHLDHEAGVGQQALAEAAAGGQTTWGGKRGDLDRVAKGGRTTACTRARPAERRMRRARVVCRRPAEARRKHAFAPATWMPPSAISACAPDPHEPGQERVLFHVQEPLQNLLRQFARCQRFGQVCEQVEAHPKRRRRQPGSPSSGQKSGGNLEACSCRALLSTPPSARALTTDHRTRRKRLHGTACKDGAPYGAAAVAAVAVVAAAAAASVAAAAGRHPAQRWSCLRIPGATSSKVPPAGSQGRPQRGSRGGRPARVAAGAQRKHWARHRNHGSHLQLDGRAGHRRAAAGSGQP